MKFLKIISSSFHPRGVRENTILTGDPLGFYGHSQKFTSEEDVIELLKFNLSYENKIDPGFDRDILIVSSNSDLFEKGQEFLTSLNNTEINKGTVFTLMRDNIGYSYGGYNAGFQAYKEEYDFFIFQEDDMVTHLPNYLGIAYKVWKETTDCGFVPFVSATKVLKAHRKALKISKNEIVSCHGGYGMSSREVLEKVTKEYGVLPFNDTEDQLYSEHLTLGEIMFTYSIKKIGYEFGELPKDILLLAPALDLMRGIEIRKFPKLFEVFMYHLNNLIKKPLYNFLVRAGLIKTN